MLTVSTPPLWLALTPPPQPTPSTHAPTAAAAAATATPTSDATHTILLPPPPPNQRLRRSRCCCWWRRGCRGQSPLRCARTRATRVGARPRACFGAFSSPLVLIPPPVLPRLCPPAPCPSPRPHRRLQGVRGGLARPPHRRVPLAGRLPGQEEVEAGVCRCRHCWQGGARVRVRVRAGATCLLIPTLSSLSLPLPPWIPSSLLNFPSSHLFYLPPLPTYLSEGG